jgi:hypothetical protein
VEGPLPAKRISQRVDGLLIYVAGVAQFFSDIVLVVLAFRLVLIVLFRLDRFEQFVCNEIYVALVGRLAVVLPINPELVAVGQLPMDPRHLGGFILQIFAQVLV